MTNAKPRYALYMYLTPALDPFNKSHCRSFPSRKFHHMHTKQPFRTFVQMDATGADQIWSSLGDAIDEIHHRNASSLSFEELYRNAYNLVLHKHGDLLYSGVSDRLATHLLETVQRLADIPDSSLLEEMAHAWSERELLRSGIKAGDKEYCWIVSLRYCDRAFPSVRPTLYCA